MALICENTLPVSLGRRNYGAPVAVPDALLVIVRAWAYMGEQFWPALFLSADVPGLHIASIAAML